MRNCGVSDLGSRWRLAELFSEIEAKSMGHGEELTSEPCCKKLKSAEEAHVLPHHGSANFHRIREKTGNDWVPVTIIDVRGHSYSQEDKTKTTDLLKPVHDEMPGNRPDVLDVIDSVDSQVLQARHPPLVSTDNEIYSTSKAFIGPIYKPPEKKKYNARRTQADTINGIDGKGGQEKKQKRSEIDSELFQFYKEIEELENKKDDSEVSGKEPEPSEGQLISYYQSRNNDVLKSEEEKEKEFSNVLQSHCGYQQYLGNEPDEYPCDGQNNEYTDCSDITSSDHPSRNGYSVQGGYASNGFCETSEGCWKDPSMDKYNGTDKFMNPQFQEEKLNKLQKLLILLRGLPGSGKTTLSRYHTVDDDNLFRILLGQSRDGIVFSTDDYFHHQDGYRYNVNQLGDAHDWNQNRAKQAINQGRSPVIIDNTNTQAWEMKPYVEMAIGKGYRVEFHEPETWWKFDPEELEK
ncbi:NEDD4-binding protein 2-like 2 [Camelus dromedarius]|uniref:NEDD4-binding protein 2-like 2 n=1 Tax=Camelus dromedarius TaxID=9838 RepID=A0A5N4D9F0_CAMDR|nr:NEDD4-binding protein 2-like 2 [Camelus dromedarius]